MSDQKQVWITKVRDGVRIHLKVTPRASRTVLKKNAEGGYKISVAKPPVDGAANSAIIKYLAKALGVAQSTIELVAGPKSKNKQFIFLGLEPEEVKAVFERITS